MSQQKNSYSLYSFLLIAACLCYASFFYYPKWQKTGPEATIGWDVAGYYNYLPAIFIYKDLKQLSYEKEILQKYNPNPGGLQALPVPNGTRVIKYSAGMAILYSPAFFTAHLWAKISPAYPADGYSFPYQLMLSIWSIIVALIGLWVLRKLLLHYFEDAATALALLSIALASNYFDYAGINHAMSHNYLFTIYALLLWQTIQFHQKGSYQKALIIGLLAGLAALSRPTEIIIVILPLVWGLNPFNKQSWQDHFKKLYHIFPKILVAAILCILIGSIQLFYWKYVTGDWIYYSYEEGFRWRHPFLMEAWFSYKTGWLVYSPIFYLAAIGFVFLGKQQKSLWLACLSFFLLFSYITVSWENWWYGGGLGLRAMVQSYVVLALPLAAFWAVVLKRKWTTILMLLFLMTNIYYNGWLTYQAHTGGLLPPSQVNKHYFWAVLGRYKIEEDIIKLLDTDEIYKKDVQTKKLLWSTDFEIDSFPNSPILPIEGEKSIFMNQEIQRLDPIVISVAQLQKGDWIRVEADYKIQQKEWNVWQMTQLILKSKKENQQLKERAIRLHRFLNDNQERVIYMDFQLSEKTDSIELHYWNADSDKLLLIDNLKFYQINP